MDIDEKIEHEKKMIHNNNDLKEEINQLNRNLNSCIDIVSSSIAGKKTNNNLDDLRNENSSLYRKVNNNIEKMIFDSENNIKNLNKKKEESSDNNNDRRND